MLKIHIRIRTDFARATAGLPGEGVISRAHTFLGTRIFSIIFVPRADFLSLASVLCRALFHSIKI